MWGETISARGSRLPAGMGAPRGSHRSVDRGTCRPGIELRNQPIQSAHGVRKPEGHIARDARASRERTLRSPETPCMHGNSTGENREIPEVAALVAARKGKA